MGDLVQKKTITPDYLTHAKKYNRGEEEMIILHNHHEPIIEWELWNIVQEELQKRNRHGKRGDGHSNRYVFSGKIKCGGCGASFVARKRYRKDESFYRCWKCYSAVSEGRWHIDTQGNTVGCNASKMLREELFEDMLRQSLQSLQLDRSRIIHSVVMLAVKAILVDETGEIGSVKKLQDKIKGIIKKKEAALDAFLSKVVTKEEMRMMMKRYERMLKDLQFQLQTLQQNENLHFDPKQLSNALQKLVTGIAQGEIKSEVFFRSILHYLTVYPDDTVDLQMNSLPQKWVFKLS